jgi:hypothetical protein
MRSALMTFGRGAWFTLWVIPFVVFALAAALCLCMMHGPRVAIAWVEENV